jgi:hypothetical protein
MKRLLLTTALFALAPAAAMAQDAANYGFSAGDQQFTLSGTGTNDNDFDSGAFGLSAGYSYFFTDNIEVGLRQDLTWADSGDDDAWNGTTRIAADYNFDLDRFQPFVGVAIGYTYGDTTNETGVIGPEAGLKFFANDTTFIYGQTSYQFFFDDSDDLNDNFDDGSWIHTVGIGFTF